MQVFFQSRRNRDIPWGSVFPEYHNPVRVGTAGVVVHAPDIRGLGEGLLVDQHALAGKAGIKAERDDMLIEPDRLLAHFTHLKRHVSPGARDPEEFRKDPAHHRSPLVNGPGHRDLSPDRVAVKSIEPAAEPVVPAVLHDVKKRRGGNRELDAVHPGYPASPRHPRSGDGRLSRPAGGSSSCHPGASGGGFLSCAG